MQCPDIEKCTKKQNKQRYKDYCENHYKDCFKWIENHIPRKTAKEWQKEVKK